MREKLSVFLAQFEEAGVLASFWALGGVVFAQFFFRYFLNMPLGWTEELARYLLIVTVFLGLPVVTRRGEHIAIEMLSNALPNRLGIMLSAFAEAVLIGIIAVLIWQAWALAMLSSQMMSSIPLPKSVIYYVVLIGLLAQIFASFARLGTFISGLAKKEVHL